MLPYNNQSGHRSCGRLPAAPPAKVKVIITTFVEVDTYQFKSVVQCLTGKESVVAEAVEEAPVSWTTGNYIDHEVHAAGERKRRREVAGSGGASVAKEEEEEVETMPAAALDELLEWLRD
ncbi:hypothetical protein ZIOFF_009460 [Zingiber officinale]|uniref:VQ domain-containing protein n=1 Tax=Zingiber officinale TaxID=94328 RepID=A0A8J5I2T5_ZINOF|nr:hypothetical protein ZIOFF_009460 [Zingiber officinale]